jgi:hypothetical protein
MSSDSYVERIKPELDELRALLAPLESGQMLLSSREGTGPWRDTTQARIAQLKRTIATFEAILAAEEKKRS